MRAKIIVPSIAPKIPPCRGFPDSDLTTISVTMAMTERKKTKPENDNSFFQKFVFMYLILFVCKNNTTIFLWYQWSISTLI